MTPDSFRAAILLPTFRRPDLLRETLETLAQAEKPASLDEVLVAENGAEAGTREICRQFERQLPVRYLYVDEASKTQALNLAIEETRADLCIFFDDDVLVGRQTLAMYDEAARRYGPGHYFGGPVMPRFEDRAPPDWMLEVLPFCTAGFHAGEEEQERVEFLGANWAAFRSDLLGVGGFSESLGPGQRFPTLFDETELQWRLDRSGCKGVYLPGAEVRHFVPAARLSLRWAADYRARQHMCRTLMDPKPRGVIWAGAPRHLWRSYIEQLVRVMAARLRHPHPRGRVRQEMYLAELSGRLRAYRLMSRGFRL